MDILICYLNESRKDIFKIFLGIAITVFSFSSLNTIADEPNPFPERPRRSYNRVKDRTYIVAGATLPKERERHLSDFADNYVDDIDKSGGEAQFGIVATFKGKKPKSMKHVKVWLSLYLKRWKKITKFKELEYTTSVSRNNYNYVYDRGSKTPLHCLAYTGPNLNKPEDTLRVSLSVQKVDRQKTHHPSIHAATEKRISEVNNKIYYVMVKPMTFLTHERIYYESISGSKALKLFSQNLALQFPFGGKTETLPRKTTNGLEKILKKLQPKR